jgi:hypothetical protein
MDGSGRVKAGERPIQEKLRQEMARGKKGNAEGGNLLVVFVGVRSCLLCLSLPLFLFTAYHEKQ